MRFNTPAPSNIVTAQLADQAVTFAKLKAAIASVWNTAAVSVNDATLTELTHDSEHIDTASIHSTVSNTARLTVPAGYSYILVGALALFAANATGYRELRIRKNGFDLTPVTAVNMPVNSAAVGARIEVVSGWLPVVEADYFSVLAFQTSGGALNVNPVRFWALLL